MTRTTEIEFKLRATRPLEVAAVDAALREMAVANRHGASRPHVDAYLDDEHGTLQRAGIGLRLRRSEQSSRLCCKTRGSQRNGRFERDEHEEPWGSTDLPRTAQELPGELRDVVEPFVLHRPLQTTLQLRTQRDVRLVQHDGRDLCELAIDHVQASTGGRLATFTELELEVIDDVATTERLAADLRAHLPLAPADDDKPTHAATLLGTLPPPATPTTLAPTTPFAEATAAVLARHLEALRAGEVAVRQDRDPEALHTLRVAVRRLRSMVRASRDLWPDERASRLLERLGEFGRQLGARRDLDVLLATVHAGIARLPIALQDGGAIAASLLAAEREQANAVLQTWLRSDAHLAVRAELEQELALPTPDGAAALAPIAVALPARLQAAITTLRKQLRTLPPELPTGAVHTVRLACKRLRYLAEEFVELPGHDDPKALGSLVALQQALGNVCDHEQAATRLATLATAAAPPLAPATIAALGGLAAGHQHAATRARRTAAKVLAKTDRKKVWRRFPAPPEQDASLAP